MRGRGIEERGKGEDKRTWTRGHSCMYTYVHVHQHIYVARVYACVSIYGMYNACTTKERRGTRHGSGRRENRRMLSLEK